MFLVYDDPPEQHVSGEREGAFLKRKNAGRGPTTIETTDGETHTYDTRWRPPGLDVATAGGFITGLVSAGLPEIMTTQLIRSVSPAAIVGVIVLASELLA